jgi:hypothetical protein
MKSEVLNFWKEIAEYLHRGIRTVQRWERDLKLPSGALGDVFACGRKAFV